MVDWGTPTPEQKAALEKAIKSRAAIKAGVDSYGEPHMGVNEFMVAEMILMASESLCGRVVRDWAEKPPERTPQQFRDGCCAFREVLESGYQERSGWWDLATVWPNPSERTLKTLLLMDLGLMFKQMRQRTLYIVPASLDLCLNVILGRGWERRFNRALKQMRQPAASGVK